MVNAVPLAPTLTYPDNNGTVISTSTSIFNWIHNDPGDPQSAASLRYKVPAGAWVTLADVVSGPTAPGTSGYVLPAGTFTSGVLYEWQMQTKDSIGQSSPWSASRFFTASATVVPPTITAPAAASTVIASPLLVSWTIPAGLVQTTYNLWVASAPGSLSGDIVNQWMVESAVQSALIDLPAGSGATQYLRVSYACAGGPSDWSAERSFVNAMLPPERPLIVLTQVPKRPEVDVQVTNPATTAGHAATVSNGLFRDGVRVSKDLPLNYRGLSRMPGAGLVEYIARSYAANGTYTDSY